MHRKTPKGAPLEAVAQSVGLAEGYLFVRRSIGVEVENMETMGRNGRSERIANSCRTAHDQKSFLEVDLSQEFCKESVLGNSTDTSIDVVVPAGALKPHRKEFDNRPRPQVLPQAGVHPCLNNEFH